MHNVRAKVEQRAAFLALQGALEGGQEFFQKADRWITIGGHEEGDRKHVGGTAVKIDDEGTIVGGGPKHMRGKKVSDIGAWREGHSGKHEESEDQIKLREHVGAPGAADYTKMGRKELLEHFGQLGAASVRHHHLSEHYGQEIPGFREHVKGTAAEIGKRALQLAEEEAKATGKPVSQVKEEMNAESRDAHGNVEHMLGQLGEKLGPRYDPKTRTMHILTHEGSHSYQAVPVAKKKHTSLNGVQRDEWQEVPEGEHTHWAAKHNAVNVHGDTVHSVGVHGFGNWRHYYNEAAGNEGMRTFKSPEEALRAAIERQHLEATHEKDRIMGPYKTKGKSPTLGTLAEAHNRLNQYAKAGNLVGSKLEGGDLPVEFGSRKSAEANPEGTKEEDKRIKQYLSDLARTNAEWALHGHYGRTEEAKQAQDRAIEDFKKVQAELSPAARARLHEAEKKRPPEFAYEHYKEHIGNTQEYHGPDKWGREGHGHSVVTALGPLHVLAEADDSPYTKGQPEYAYRAHISIPSTGKRGHGEEAHGHGKTAAEAEASALQDAARHFHWEADRVGAKRAEAFKESARALERAIEHIQGGGNVAKAYTEKQQKEVRDKKREEYGTKEYFAVPGLDSYPLTEHGKPSEERVRAAWGYIHQEDNRAKLGERAGEGVKRIRAFAHKHFPDMQLEGDQEEETKKSMSRETFLFPEGDAGAWQLTVGGKPDADLVRKAWNEVHSTKVNYLLGDENFAAAEERLTWYAQQHSIALEQPQVQKSLLI